MKKASRRYYFEQLIVFLFVACIAGLLVRSDLMKPLSNFVYDNMQPLLPVNDFSGITIVAIDDESLERIGSWPWDRKTHADLIQQFDKYKSKAVVFDLIFAEKDEVRPESDAALMRALDQHGSVFLPVHLMTDNFGNPHETMPYNFFAQTSAGMGHVNARLEEDGIVRGVYMRTGIGQPSWEHISLALYDHISPRRIKSFRMRSETPSDELTIEQRYYRMIPFADASEHSKVISAADVLEDNIDAEDLKDQIVFVGATASSLGDMLPTPMKQSRGRMTGVEMNANVFASLKNKTLITPMPLFWQWVLAVTLTLITTLLFPRIAPKWAIPLVVLMLATTLLLSFALLTWKQIWFQTGSAITSIIIIYPLWTWRRLEYSLRHVTNTLKWLTVHDELNQRLIQPTPLDKILPLLQQILPITSWQLVGRESKTPLASSTSDGPTEFTHQYPFICLEDELELQVNWSEGHPEAAEEQWLRSALKRCNDTIEAPYQSWDLLEEQINRVHVQEQQQQALTQFFEVSLAQLREGIVITDATGQLLFINQQAEKWLQIPAKNMQEFDITAVTGHLVLPTEGDNWPELIARTISSGRVQLECRTDSGIDIYLDLFRLDAGERVGEILILTLKDISDVKQAMHSKNEMLDFMSHDLRSPMISLLALADRHKNSPEPTIKELTAYTKTYAQRSLNIAEQFLQLARAESTDAVDFAPVDMLAIAESAIEQTVLRAESKQQEIKFDYTNDDVWVNGHFELLMRALENLLSNAVKYSGNNTCITVSLQCNDAAVICSVSDQGQGIEEEFLADLFKSYTRSKQQKDSKIKGAGLGLRFVQVVMQRHNGSVEVDSALDEGSRFTLTLPKIEME